MISGCVKMKILTQPLIKFYTDTFTNRHRGLCIGELTQSACLALRYSNQSAHQSDYAVHQERQGIR